MKYVLGPICALFLLAAPPVLAGTRETSEEVTTQSLLSPDSPVGEYDGGTLTVAELRAYLELTNFPSRKLLNEYERVLTPGAPVRPIDAALTESVLSVVKEAASAAILGGIVGEDGNTSETQAIEQLAIELLADEAKERWFQKEPDIEEPAEDQVEERAFALRELNARPEYRQIRQIILPKSCYLDSASHSALAPQLLERLNQGEDFAALASVYSYGHSARHGGLRGPISSGALPPALGEAVFAAPLLGPPQLVEEEDAYHIFRVEQITPAYQPSVEELLAPARAALRSAAINKARQAQWGKFEKQLEAMETSPTLALSSESAIAHHFLLPEWDPAERDVYERVATGVAAHRHWVQNIETLAPPPELEEVDAFIVLEQKKGAYHTQPRYRVAQATLSAEPTARITLGDFYALRRMHEQEAQQLVRQWESVEGEQRLEKARASAIKSPVGVLQVHDLGFADPPQLFRHRIQDYLDGSIYGPIAPPKDDRATVHLFWIVEMEEARPLSMEQARPLAASFLQSSRAGAARREAEAKLLEEKRFRIAPQFLPPDHNRPSAER